MKPGERLLAAYRGDPVDRVPLNLLGFNFADWGDVEKIENPARRSIAERIYEHTAYLIGVPTFINRYLVTPPQRMRRVVQRQTEDGHEVVTEIDTPKGKLTAVTGMNKISGATTWTIKYPVEDMEDIEKIRSIPWERPLGLKPVDPGSMPADREGRNVVYARISSPFVCVAGMMPFEYFLFLCATELNLIKELTAQCLERILNVLDVLLSKPGIDVVWMGGCEWLTAPMASPQIYEELVQEQERLIIERVHAAGVLVHVHCHGNVRDTIGLVLERGADFFEPMEPPPDGNITMAEARELVGDRMTLGGNVESRLIEYGRPDEFDQAVRDAFSGGKHRFVLQPTEGMLTGMTEMSIRNYHRLIDIWEEMSPINGGES